MFSALRPHSLWSKVQGAAAVSKGSGNVAAVGFRRLFQPSSTLKAVRAPGHRACRGSAASVQPVWLPMTSGINR